ncbi:MAG: hypothetical protein ACXWCZ_02265 [Flavisolibacter sp.]
MNKEEIIPENNSGIQTNTESNIELNETGELQEFFSLVKSRLLHINFWHELAGRATADFQLCNDKGQPVDRKPQPGDHIRIDIPGPGTITGEGNDWVRIEEVIEEEDSTCIRVRPATNPLNERKDIAHFFSDEATSTFMVKKSANKITAGVYGRNEKPNTGSEKIIDKIRNTAIATGAISGFSKLQWKSLVNGLVKRES